MPTQPDDILATPVSRLRGVGEKTAAALAELGTYTAGDMLRHYPRRYEDRRLTREEEFSSSPRALLLRVAETPAVSSARGFKLLKFRCVEAVPENGAFRDTGAAVEVTFFNMVYLKNTFRPGSLWRFYGVVEKSVYRSRLTNPKFEPYSPNLPDFVPIYAKTRDLTQHNVKSAAEAALALALTRGEELETLPADLRLKYNLCHASYALENIHKPGSPLALDAARRRLVFEELLLYTLGLRLFRNRRGERAAPPPAASDTAAFWKLLPFPPTEAQRRVVGEIASDMAGALPMNRLVQGDVGSGKTAVAAAAVYFAASAGFQSSLMVPTEILAVQHYKWLSEILAPAGIKTVLLTGSMRAAERRAALEEIASGRAGLVIGTHALLSKGVEFARLGLVITDEQHRFGVAQRALQAGKPGGEWAPHTLVMSATPIPRTLALIMYGDLDVSVIDSLPPGRQKVDTFLVNESMRQRIYKFIRRLVAGGGRVFIVCQLIGSDGEEGDSEGASALKSVSAYYKKLSGEVFPDIPSAFLHGRMSQAQKDKIMSQFASGEVAILVSTVVIEVGVNIPEAVLMVVEDAERLGLSQLHQLRGRVGRGTMKSYCVLFSETESEESRARLEALTKTNDGFEIARRDIELRGPGDLFGERQSGRIKFHIADLSADMETLLKAAEEAKTLAPRIMEPELDRLREAVARLFAGEYVAFN